MPRRETTARPSLNQVLEVALPGDAMFHFARAIREWAEARGYESHILANIIHPAVRREVDSFWRHGRDGRGNLYLYHFGLDGEAMQFIKKVKTNGGRIALLYYDLTPSKFFQYEDPILQKQLKDSETQLQKLSSFVEKTIAISEYSKMDLLALGFPHVDVVPPVMLDEKWADPPDAKVIQRYGDGKVNLLFVGRLAPNKRQEDIIKTFYYYKRLNPHSRLLLVGSLGTTQVYYRWLLDLVEYLGLKDVHFCGHVTQRELNAYYRVADAFISMSEHEGFGIPLIESMYCDVPVIAYQAAAVPETLGDAGILIKRKDFSVVAELIHLLLEDEELRRRVVEGQRERLKVYSLEKVQQAFWRQVAPLLGEPTSAI